MILSKRRVSILVIVLIQCLLCLNGFAQDASEEIQLAESESEEVITNEVYPYGDADWKYQGIGEVTVHGTAEGLKRDINVGGAGSGIQGKNDSFHFVYQEIKGDFTIQTNYVKACYSEEPTLKAGIMIRESLYSDSAYLGMFLTKNSSLGEPIYSSQIQIRKAWENNTKIIVCKDQELKQTSKYRGFKINRTGDKITCYSLTDNGEWLQEGNPTVIEIGKTAYVGMCVTSEDPTTLAHAAFAGAEIIQHNKSIYTKPWESGTYTDTNSVVNLAVGKPVREATFKNKFIPQNAVDGDNSTNWTVAGLGQPLVIDLENIYDIYSFEMLIPSSQAYRYTIETSVDGCYYTKVVNKAKNTAKKKLFQDSIKPIEAQYIKLTVDEIYNSSSIELNVKEFRILGDSNPKELDYLIFGTGFMKTDVWDMTGCEKVYLGYKNWALEFRSDSELSTTVSTEGYSDIKLDVGRWVKRCEGKEYFTIEWYDGEKWEVLEEIKGNERAEAVNFVLPESASDNKELKIRFRTDNFDDDDLAYLNGVALSGMPIQ